MFLDARQARMFCVLAEELHFGRAAKRLFISQPPLSHAIRQLEDELQTELFVRTTRSVKLTRTGEFLYQHLKQLEHDTAHIKTSIWHISQGMRGVVRVGVTPSGVYSNFSHVLRYFSRYHPDIVLNVTESRTDIMLDKILRNILDIAFMRPLSPLHGLSTQVVYREPLCLAVPADHQLASHDIIRPDDLQGRPLVTYDPVRSPYFHRLTTDWLSAMNIAMRPVQESILPTTLALVDGGLGLAIVPSAFARFKTFGLSYIPLAQPEQHLAEISVAWREDQADPLVLSVVELLKSGGLFDMSEPFSTFYEWDGDTDRNARAAFDTEERRPSS